MAGWMSRACIMKIYIFAEGRRFYRLAYVAASLVNALKVNDAAVVKRERARWDNCDWGSRGFC